MNKKIDIKFVSTVVLIILVLSSFVSVYAENITNTSTNNIKYVEKSFEIDFSFSYPEIVKQYSYSVIRVNETNHNRIIMFDYSSYYPVLPVNLSVFEFPFGSKIIDVTFENNSPEIINLDSKLSYGRGEFDSIEPIEYNDPIYGSLYNNLDEYPDDWVLYHTGGGLSYGKRTSFFVLRVYPVRYYPNENQIGFVSHITVNVTYSEPEEPLINEEEKSDLIIISPNKYINLLEPLVSFKNNQGIKTRLFSTEEIYNNELITGRDRQEKIKYFIKESIERWDIKHVLLVGGLNGQNIQWDLPIRYSYVVPTDEQEYPEQKFVSDLYYADIYDSKGNFSSWDSNGDDKFSVWNDNFKEKMDLYPDVYLGRLPCRNKLEVKTMVNKIINYEKNGVSEKDWFKNLLLVAGDSYVNHGQWPEGEVVKEGEIACNEAIKKLPGCNPLKVYSSNEDINGRTVNNKFNKGAGFAYFCGHGSRVSWSTHFPDPVNESSNWTTRYHVKDMIFLRNHEKQPVTVVGGCHNGEFDKTIFMNIFEGIKNNGLQYFIGRFLFDGWTPKCWAWWLTSKPNGGAIATIANTGLGTHGDGDQDLNGIVDYIEILDGWLELRFFELYGLENQNDLGLNHGHTLTEYLHKFLGDDSKMDVKMVQQWQLFGDPSLKIGGYV